MQSGCLGGENSGASQPHKHIQFVPLPDGAAPPIERLARAAQLQAPGEPTHPPTYSSRFAYRFSRTSKGKPFSLSALPYANFVLRLPTAPADADTLAHAYLPLLDLAISAVRHADCSGGGGGGGFPAGAPSYNVVLTTEHMHVVPRRRDEYVLPDVREGEGEGEEPLPRRHGEAMLPVNALGFAGMLLVRSEAELAAVAREGVGRVLSGVGVNSALVSPAGGGGGDE